MSKVIIKWSTFSYILNTALSLMQQVIFTCYLTTYSVALWSVLVIDIFFIIYILYNSTPRLLVIQGARCWAAHTRLLIFKIIFIYLFILPTGISDKALLLRGLVSMGNEISLVNSLTVLIYVLWIFQIGTMIYNGIRKISIEHMLHIELALRVFIDLMDIIDATHNFIFERNVQFLGHFVLFGYVISLYFHGYSFPRMGVEKYLNLPDSTHSISIGANEDINSSGDVRYCRKNAIIVGTWFVDVLIGSCRIVAIYITKNSGFSIFLIKNIYSIVLYFGLFSSISIIPKLLKSNESMSGHLSENKFDLKKIGSVKTQFSIKSKQFDKVDNQNYLWSSKESNKNYFSKSGICLSPNLFEYLYKITSSLEFSSKTDLHHFLNPTCVQFNYKLRIIFPYISFVFLKILFVLLFNFATNHNSYNTDFITAYFTADSTDATAQIDKTYGHLVIAVIAAIFLLNFACFVTITTLFEAIFSGLFAAIRFLSFIAMLSLFSQSKLLNMIVTNLNLMIMKSLGNHILCVFAIWPCINLLSNMYPFISAILGKQFNSYIILSTDNFGDTRDQVGVIPTNTLILLVTAQNLLLPKSMYKYFSGNYVVSTYRLNIMLSWVHTRRVFMSIYMRILLLLSVGNASYSIYIPIFGIHALFLMHYLLSTRTVRHAIINKTELQRTLKDANEGLKGNVVTRDFDGNVFTSTCKLLPDLLY